MRVAQVTSYFEPHLGGVETHVRELSRALTDRGVDVTVVCADTEGSGARDRLYDFDVVRVPPRSTLLKTPSMPGVADAVGGGKFDLVHSHTPPPVASWRAARAARRARVPHVMTFHCDPEIPLPMGGLLVDLWRLTYGRATLRRTDRLVSTTHSYASTSRTLWNYDTTVIPNGVDTEVFRPAQPGEALPDLPGEPGFRVLAVGRLVQHKGIEQLIDAVSKLPAPAHLLVAGEGELRAAVEARARASPAAGRITFLGRVPHEDLPRLYRACDVFALPSVSRLEAFGIVALEAMASGLPVVASDMPGVREIVTEGMEGHLANPLDPLAFASRIDSLLRRPLRRARFGRNGRAKVVAGFTWDAVAGRVLELYEQVLAGGEPAPAASPSAGPAAAA
ncbi:MAG TPA: glycosyltransferase family 4 protein [Candidatus Thermoplasmatota archaeon]